MQPLEKSLRNKLERTIKEARDVAEAAAKASLEQLGVGEAAPFAHLSEQERELRRKLRVHGRQLGDTLNGGKIQTMERLVEEVAYEHWHRMLFARFLAENNLLMYWPDGDDEPIDVDLETCQGLLDDGEEQADSVWELAARFAARMLPQIFRLDSPVFQLVLPPEYQQKLEHLLADLPLEVFTASDSLGWVYQFWQAKKKDEVNASEVKIGARELPAVTQLFTEPYMVSFLLDNSLGAWWAARNLSDADFENYRSEEELRNKASIPGVPLDYLRFVKQENGAWTPAAGTFDGWPEQLAELKTLDPCCGSGHFLVAAFLMLVPMRMERDGLSAQDAVGAVLRDNIHGLELDRRCVELAAFALALTAWKFPGAGGYRPLPELNVACSGLAISAKKEEWLTLAGDNTNLRFALEALYKQFKDAPVLGSLINPKASLGKGTLFELKWEEVGPLLTKALAGEEDDEKAEMGVVASGIAKSANLLAGKYDLLVTNVPYLGRGKQTELMQKFCDVHFGDSRSDLATSFIERCLHFNIDFGVSNLVLPQNWLFLSSYRRLREKILKTDKLRCLVKLGSGAFETISGEVVKAGLLSIENNAQKKGHQFTNIPNKYFGLDVSDVKGAEQKGSRLKELQTTLINQGNQLKNPDARILIEDQSTEFPLLSKYCKSFQGIKTGDDPRFKRVNWEISDFIRWRFSQGGPYGQSVLGNIFCLDWVNKGVDFARLQGLAAQRKSGLSVCSVSKILSLDYYGVPFTSEVSAIIPQDEGSLLAIKAYLEHPAYENAVRSIDDKVAITNATLVKVPFDLDHWTKVAKDKYPQGLPKPYSDDLTQWIFHGHPCGSVVWNEQTKWTTQGPLRIDNTVLQVTAARLLGYRWPAELDASMELADEQRQWVDRCESLLPYADEDGIVCIPPVRGETSAADRLLNLLAEAYGDAWSNDTLAQLLNSADHAGKTLETWLREKFFTQHCKLFQHRPFIWHIWDGLRDGFAALVNYHKLDTKLLETLIYTYLGDWISRQKEDIANGVDGAQEKLAAAEALKKKLELILEGEAPYDIFVRWKPIDKQAIGWNPDLNDGVRLNIRPFLTVPDVGKKGASVLRDKPNIKWSKDRGKDVASAPWYHLGLEYGGKEGDRINDHHLSLADKRDAGETKNG